MTALIIGSSVPMNNQLAASGHQASRMDRWDIPRVLRLAELKIDTFDAEHLFQHNIDIFGAGDEKLFPASPLGCDQAGIASLFGEGVATCFGS